MSLVLPPDAAGHRTIRKCALSLLAVYECLSVKLVVVFGLVDCGRLELLLDEFKKTNMFLSFYFAGPGCTYLSRMCPPDGI